MDADGTDIRQSLAVIETTIGHAPPSDAYVATLEQLAAESPDPHQVIVGSTVFIEGKNVPATVFVDGEGNRTAVLADGSALPEA